MPFFRSAKMARCEIVLHIESAFDCVVEMGFLGMAEFIENPEKSQRFVAEEQRCAEMVAIVERLQVGVDNCNLKTAFYPDADEEEIPQKRDLEKLEAKLQKTDHAYNEVQLQYNVMYDEYDTLMENHHVLERASEFLDGSRSGSVYAWSDSITMNLISDEVRHLHGANHLRLSYFLGSIPVERFPAFELMLWRICHSNFYLKHSEIPLSPKNEKSVHPTRKFAFMVFFVGDQLRTKIEKVCQGFKVRLIECSESSEERQRIKLENMQRLSDMKKVLDEGHRELCSIMEEAADKLHVWRVKSRKMLMVFQALNEFTTVPDLSSTNYLKINAWIPADETDTVRTVLWRGARRSTRGGAGLIFPPMVNILPRTSSMRPPTHFKLNIFTKGFQNLINAYGIATYREINPSPYSVITFPFLFSVMFGDIGHGIIMSLFGVWLVYNEKKLERQQLMAEKPSDIFDLVFAGRYVILLMGLFSVYAGLLYNDIFSKPLNIFGSAWRANLKESDKAEHYITLDPATKDYVGRPYWVGVDPAWHLASNAITTQNSIKMKLAIILGVSHMMLGLGLEAYDNYKTNAFMELSLVTVPSIVFFVCIFCYLAFMILLKWAYYGGHLKTPWNSACAPSVLIRFINMLLLKPPPEPYDECLLHMFAVQHVYEDLFLIFAFIAVIVLLIGKPIYVIRREKKVMSRMSLDSKRRSRRATVRFNVGSLASEGRLQRVASTEMIVQADRVELWIQAGMHCVESVLGAVSHTASYLRLWALSLAHSQLSMVLWDMVLRIGLKGKNGYVDAVIIFLTFWVWSCLTLAILVLMEGLSAFLHTLRLHWVEFQSKFYEGAGNAFRPFYFGKTKTRQKDAR